MPDYIADPRAYRRFRRQFNLSRLAKKSSSNCTCICGMLPCHKEIGEFSMSYGEAKNNYNAVSLMLPAFTVLLLFINIFFIADEAIADGFYTPLAPGFNIDNSWYGGGANPAGGGCSFGGSTCGGNLFTNGDPTPFYQQLENINGTVYFHVLVGDAATGFAQESYTRYGANSGSLPDGRSLEGAFSPDAGGNENLGASCSGGACLEQDAELMAQYANLANPLGGPHVSGTGSADPSKTVFRMVLTSADGDMSLEVDKPFLDMKPLITQTVQDGSMKSTFVADMRGLSYQDMNNPINIVNSTVIDDPTIPGGGAAASFTMDSVQQSNVTAGRFTYTRGAGWNNPDGWDAANSSFDLGTYDYYGAATGFDVYNMDWTKMFDYNQNILNCTRLGTTSSGSGVTSIGTRNDMGQGGGLSCPGHP